MNITIRLKNIICAGLGCCALASVPLIVFIPIGIQSEQSYEEPAFVKINACETKVVDGFCIGLTGRDKEGRCSTNNTSPDHELFFIPWTTDGSAWFAVPIEPEYAYQVELFDTNGAAMPRTEQGQKVGTKFFDFTSSAPKEGIGTKRLRADRKGQPVGMPLLFRPSDLFKVDEPGNYKLQVRFQILTFPRTGPNREDYTNHLIRFPSLEYPLIQPESSQKPR